MNDWVYTVEWSKEAKEFRVVKVLQFFASPRRIPLRSAMALVRSGLMKLAPICADHVRQFLPLGDQGKQLVSCLRVRDLASRVVAFARISSAFFRTCSILPDPLSQRP